MTPSDGETPLRVLHLTAGSDAGGLSRYVFDLCSAMHRAGHQVAVAGERGAWHGMFAGAGWPWIDAPLKGGPVALWRAVRVLRQYLAAHPVDVLHTHYRRATLVARRLQRGAGGPPPVLYTVHLSDLSLRWPWRRLTDFGDHTHVASRQAGEWVTRAAGVPPEHVTFVPHGIDPARFPVTTPADRRAARAALGLADADRVAAYVGRLDDPKNEDWLLDLAAASDLPGLRVLLAGDGPHEQAVRRRVAAEGLADRVRLLGHRDDPLPVYRAADALLLPSAREGFSLACAEAMCTGLPVLRTRTAGAGELSVEGVTGRSVPVDRSAFLAAAAEFLRDGDALARMGPAAAGHIRAQYTFDRQVTETLRLYRRLAGDGGKGDEENAE